MDYDVRLSMGKKGCEPLSALVMEGDYRIPVATLIILGALCIALCVCRFVCFHIKYKKRM